MTVTSAIAAINAGRIPTRTELLELAEYAKDVGYSLTKAQAEQDSTRYWKRVAEERAVEIERLRSTSLADAVKYVTQVHDAEGQGGGIMTFTPERVASIQAAVLALIDEAHSRSDVRSFWVQHREAVSR